MVPIIVILCEDVEDEGNDIVKEGLVLDEELRKEAEVLAVDMFSAYHFKGSNLSIGIIIDWPWGRRLSGGRLKMLVVRRLTDHVLECRLANVEALELQRSSTGAAGAWSG